MVSYLASCVTKEKWPNQWNLPDEHPIKGKFHIRYQTPETEGKELINGKA